MQKQLIFYKTVWGQVPARKFLLDIKDKQARAAVFARLDRMLLGHFGDYKKLSKGISEIRIDRGPGYRIYFTEIGGSLILLLNAGTKKTQKQDIDKAVEFLQTHKKGSRYV